MNPRDIWMCPYQKGQTTVICEACRLMVPSIEEEKKYCSGNFRDCPYYQTAAEKEREEVWSWS